MKDYSFETSVKNCEQLQKKLLNEINQKDIESKLRLDIEGFDAVSKWILLLTHSYGISSTIDDLLFKFEKGGLSIRLINDESCQFINRLE
jgi:homoserine dehydrogenase